MVNDDRLEPVVDAILAESCDLDAGRLPVVVTPNVDIVVSLDRDPASTEADVFRRASFILPDGMPIVAASKVLGAPLRARLTGSGLFELLWPRLVAEQKSLTVVCSEDEIAIRLGDEHPTASFVVPPIFDPTVASELDSVVDQIMAQIDFETTEFVLLGLGHPKDAVLVDSLMQRQPKDPDYSPLYLGLGGSFAMYTGLKKRAPGLVQRLGLEWFYRFTQEPRRLFSRYFVHDMAFFAIVGRELLALRRRAQPSRRREQR
ncbi:MAG: WecB/TagA/CpsF family glycosyltransferase [Actinomycetia bacterium]|nr:WecB/TagA/CpsF family glycosyltransferase [Actinomycetes bacterium]